MRLKHFLVAVDSLARSYSLRLANASTLQFFISFTCFLCTSIHSSRGCMRHTEMSHESRIPVLGVQAMPRTLQSVLVTSVKGSGSLVRVTVVENEVGRRKTGEKLLMKRRLGRKGLKEFMPSLSPKILCAKHHQHYKLDRIHNYYPTLQHSYYHQGTGSCRSDSDCLARQIFYSHFLDTSTYMPYIPRVLVYRISILRWVIDWRTTTQCCC